MEVKVLLYAFLAKICTRANGPEGSFRKQMAARRPSVVAGPSVSREGMDQGDHGVPPYEPSDRFTMKHRHGFDVWEALACLTIIGKRTTHLGIPTGLIGEPVPSRGPRLQCNCQLFRHRRGT